MPVGSKWQLFIPPDLAYGERSPSPVIGVNSTLILTSNFSRSKASERARLASMDSHIATARGLRTAMDHGLKLLQPLRINDPQYNTVHGLVDGGEPEEGFAIIFQALRLQAGHTFI